MALLLSITVPSLSSLSPSSSLPPSSFAISATRYGFQNNNFSGNVLGEHLIDSTPLSAVLRVHNQVAKPSLFNGLQSKTPYFIKKRCSVIIKASSEIDGTISENTSPPSDVKKEVVPVENLPLESKKKLLEELRIKMKLAKKIRLRRKRLVRKRHLRKKGRWPPSKMKKNKNV